VGLDVPGGVGARSVQPGIRPGGGTRQRQLQDGSDEPGGSDGGRASRQGRHGCVSLIAEYPPPP
jgi:hypothetical protein